DWNKTPPKLAWKLEGVGDGYASVSILGSRLYTTGNVNNSQSVIAIDLNSKSIAWTTPITESNPKHGYEGSRCTPSIDGDRLYVVTSNGQITCLKSTDGSINWKKEFTKDWGGRMMSGWGFSESPLVDGDWVLCTPGGETAMIVALNKMTGDLVWKSEVPDQGQAGNPGAGYSSIIVSNGAGVKQYVQLIGRGLIGVRASDGKHLWSYNRIANGTANIPTPIAKDDFVFGSTGYGGGGSALLKLVREGDGVTAVEQYYKASKELQNHHGGMVLDGDFLYFGHGHNKGFPVCVDMLSGKVQWGGEQNRGPGNGSAAITFADGHIIFRYQSGEVALVEATPKEYQLKGVFKPEVQIRESWAHPVIVDGKLFLREQDTLMCYDIAK
ncbi:MAG: polyvinylalcohol dehydrogenase, partial [Planctomycetes bacterium]|nr:polyvinylalcohol dehydrogenase [Planctomycetota bacterium]